MAAPLSFRWDQDFIQRVDEARGLVPRSAFVRQAVEAALGEASGSVGGSDSSGSPAGSSPVQASPRVAAVATRKTLSQELAENPGTPLPPKVPPRGGWK